MADLLSIARPYAHATFDYAREKQQLPAWKSFLESAANVARHPSVIKLLGNPEVEVSKVHDLFAEILAPQLDEEKKNFLLLLAQNKRFFVLPEIQELFNDYLAQFEKMATVQVVTAINIEEEFKNKLAAALTKRVQQQVTLECRVDPAIMGGAIIQIGDRVIDGSIRGKLDRLLQNLTG